MVSIYKYDGPAEIHSSISHPGIPLKSAHYTRKQINCKMHCQTFATLDPCINHLFLSFTSYFLTDSKTGYFNSRVQWHAGLSIAHSTVQLISRSTFQKKFSTTSDSQFDKLYVPCSLIRYNKYIGIPTFDLIRSDSWLSIYIYVQSTQSWQVWDCTLCSTCPQFVNSYMKP